jgi:8-oxo-dGTP pyrophosphatase MutT (NUDIX family)
MTKKSRKAQVVIAVIDPDSQFSFLLLLTNQLRGSFWQNVTGKIEDHESYEEGALREAIEETDLALESIVEIIDLKLSHEFFDIRNRDVHEKSFLILLDKKWDVKIDPSEHQDYQWLPFNEISLESVKYRGNFEALEKSQHLLKHWGV